MILRYLVSGRVQGVGYRWFVRDRCRALEISGFVKNLTGGQVEVVASGSPEAHRDLQSVLLEAYPGAVVTKVDKHEISDEVSLPTGFRIKG